MFKNFFVFFKDIGFLKSHLGSMSIVRYKTSLVDLVQVVSKWSSIFTKADQSGQQDLMDMCYVYGFFDGEGCVYGVISFRKDTVYCYNIQVGISIGQANQRAYLLTFAKKVLGVGDIYNLTVNYKQYRIRNQPDVKLAASILLLGSKAKRVQLKLALYLMDNWASMAKNPISFLRNCYLVEYMQSLNDQNTNLPSHSPADVKSYMISKGYITQEQATQAHTQAQAVISDLSKN